MGLEISKNDKGEYNLLSTISDMSWHPDNEWVTEDEAKKLLIHDLFFKFVNDAINIDMTFPNRYNVNGERHYDESKPDFNKFIGDAYKSKDVDKIINDKFSELHERLKLDIKI